MKHLTIFLATFVLGGLARDVSAAVDPPEQTWETCLARGRIHADCVQNARRLLEGWIDLKRDPKTNLYSRGRVWDYENEAADHYSSLVLIAHYVRPELLRPKGSLHETLLSSQRLCTSESGLPRTYDLSTGSPGPIASYEALTEWQRDGLIRIAEILGTDNDWYRELERLTDAMLADAAGRGGIAQVLKGHEPQGNMLQTLARLYVMSGKEEYLQAGEQIADLTLPRLVRHVDSVRFGDHGCELVPGLAELFVVECRRKRPKADEYREPMRRLLDRILADAAHPDTGLFCQSVAGPGGGGARSRPPDTWGYVLFAFENYDRATGEKRYTAAVEKPLRWLAEHRDRYEELKDTLWPQSKSSDDWSDSYESMIVLWNRCPRVEGVFDWLDWATLRHVHRRPVHPRYGPFTGGHFDGSTGRTLCIHAMLCSQGVRARPPADSLRLGAVQSDGELFLTLETDAPWRGALLFDGPRTEHRGGTIDWARINEMPQWFVVRPERKYRVALDGEPPTEATGRRLIDGLAIESQPGSPRRVRVTPLP